MVNGLLARHFTKLEEGGTTEDLYDTLLSVFTPGQIVTGLLEAIDSGNIEKGLLYAGPLAEVQETFEEIERVPIETGWGDDATD